MCKILLKNNFFIVPVNHGYQLRKTIIKIKDGEVRESIKRFGYSSTIKECIQNYIKQMTDELLENEQVELIQYAKMADQCAKIAVDGLHFEKNSILKV